MTILVIAEHDNSNLKGATLNTITAASELGPVTILVAGSGCTDVANIAAKDEYLQIVNTHSHTIKTNNASNQSMPNKIPSAVATPFPPWNL